MGRETKFLLAVLAALTGAFVGVLSMKLLVPRPPAGAGPDVEAPHQLVESQDLVEPPALGQRSIPASIFAAAPDLVPQPKEANEDSAAAAAAVAAPVRDPFVARTVFQEPTPPPPAAVEPPADLTPPPTAFEQPHASAASEADPSLPQPPSYRSFSPSPDPAPQPPSTLPIAGSYVAQPGDSWWSLAERAYGDGRLYRALFAWNRTLDPRVSLTPGTPLEIPPQARLQAAWPKLLPRE